MWSDAQIDAASAAAAEKANGGKFTDPLFYKPDHKAFWREVVQAALDATELKFPDASKAVPEEIAKFSDHCTYIRSIYRTAIRIWRDRSDVECKDIETIAPILYEQFGDVLAEFTVNSACRVTERAVTREGHENLTTELFLASFPKDSETYKQLDELHRSMRKHRNRIAPARNKLGAHADRETIRKGKALATASWDEWDKFWSDLEQFVRVLNEKTKGQPYDINASQMLGEAECLLKAIHQSDHFESLLKSDDPVVQQACKAIIASTK